MQGSDFTYTIEYSSANELLVLIEYKKESNLEINTEIRLTLLIDDYINDNQYILVEKNFTYLTTNT